MELALKFKNAITLLDGPEDEELALSILDSFRPHVAMDIGDDTVRLLVFKDKSGVVLTNKHENFIAVDMTDPESYEEFTKFVMKICPQLIVHIAQEMINDESTK